jgi:D-glycero-D-manno-heptose 1,7-bisphosphate phosphatase
MKLVLLDRDGVINEDQPDFVKNPEELVLLPAVGESISRLNAYNIRVALVTNQSVVGRKIITEAMLHKIHERMRQLLAKNGAKIDKIIYCPDHPDNSTDRRKPGGGMLTEAMLHFDSDPNRTIMIGDSLIDLQAAARVNCHRMLVLTGKGRKTLDDGIPKELQPVNVAVTLMQAVDNILSGHIKPKG